jgi:hypothetical protein
MDRRKKIVQCLVALLTALASLFGGGFTVSTATAAPTAAPSATATAGAGGAGAAEAADGDDPRDRGAEVFQGWGFDTCSTPSLGTMNAWRTSHYRAVGIYFGGRGRHCKQQPNLGRRWVRSVDRWGWNILPIYVGSQSPCVVSDRKRKVAMGDDPWHEGAYEGYDAARRAEVLGLRERSPLYLDMEAYDDQDADCADTTLAFIRAWSREVREQGYIPGFYSSADSGVRHLERARLAGVADLPEVMWFARWRVRPTIYGEPVLDRAAWRPHRRIHQYAGDVTEQHGGESMLIDRNKVDAPVAIID